MFYFYCFTDQTLQILQQAENQLINSSSSRLRKREIPELSNPQDLVQMLENIQGRLLGWDVYIKKAAFIKFLREEVILQASLCHIIIFVFL